MKTDILINRGGGALGDRGLVARADVLEALRSAGIEAEPQWLRGHEIREAAQAAVAGGAKLVITGGGDGTISCVAGAVAGTEAVLGVLPLGTLNHFARDLGIPADLNRAATLIVAGKPRVVDVAKVNGHVFVNTSAIGVYPLMVLDRDAQRARLGRSKRVAMAIATAHALLRFSSRRLALTVNDRQAQVDTPLLFVGNNAYSIQLPDAGRREALDRGELFVLLLRRTSRLGFFLAASRALIGRVRKDDVVRLEHVERLRVDSRHTPLAVSLDGETVRMEPPLEYRICKKALSVIAP